MHIGYCPKCGKAGLRWENPDESRPRDIPYSLRYCPRCKIWVAPPSKEVATHAHPGKAPRTRCR